MTKVGETQAKRLSVPLRFQWLPRSPMALPLFHEQRGSGPSSPAPTRASHVLANMTETIHEPFIDMTYSRVVKKGVDLSSIDLSSSIQYHTRRIDDFP